MNRPLLFLLAALTCTACKKDDDDPAPSGTVPLQTFGVQTYGIFMWEVDGNTDGYLQADDAGGYIFRGQVPSSYPLSNLAEDNNCRLELTSVSASGGATIYGIRMPDTEDWWIPIVNGTDTLLHQEDLNTETVPSAGTIWQWKRHNIGSQGGETLYAMESCFYPGMYWTIQGTIVSWNLIRLQRHATPAEAQGFLFR